VRLVDGQPPHADALELIQSPFPARRSGETKRSRRSPLAICFQASRVSAGSLAELNVAAGTPTPSSWRTWSRISAIKGETTTVRPPPTTAGSW
jgi:hypothetical protein